MKLNGGEQQKDHEEMAIKEFVIDIMENTEIREIRCNMQKRSEREILMVSSTKEENTDQNVIHTLILEYLTVNIRHRTHSISSY